MLKLFSYLLSFLMLSSLALAQPKALYIDTDAGSDDAIALLYLLAQRPSLPIKAIIVDQNGEGTPGQAIEHIVYLLQLMHRTDIPIYPGLLKAPTCDNRYPLNLQIEDNKLFPPIAKTPYPPILTRQELIEQLMQASSPVQILSLGSLTNLSDLIQTKSVLKKHIENITLMGGAVKTQGNIQALRPELNNPYAEWNIFVDPQSFSILLTHHLPMTLVSLDITQTVPIQLSFLDQIQFLSPPQARFTYHILDVGRHWIMAHDYDFWDPLAAYVFLHPKAVKTQTIRLSVVTTAGPHFGQTYMSEKGSSVKIVTAINKEAFEKSLLSALAYQSKDK